jgi:hypothetical protein
MYPSLRPIYIFDSFLSKELRTGSEFPEIHSTSIKKLPCNSHNLIANARLKPEQKQARVKD